MTAPIRLDKRVAELRHCSRAQAQRLIEGGWVRVDDAVVEACQAMVSTQRVSVDPQARPDAIAPVTLLLHKPAGVDSVAAAALATAAAHAADDRSGVRPLGRHLHRLVPLMPLDADADGLMVLSQDGRVVRRLSEDVASLEQEFIVEIRGEMAVYGLARLGTGLRYRGRILQPAKVSWQNEVRLRFALKDVQPGQLRFMCGEVGLDVVAMRRIRIGRVVLGKMPAGQWRYLPPGDRF
ncbi:rRNA pseudouridine synthase [Chiayiivirga flava]|uniref:Dual-specificity RNA pseudouridine synthase RluF n=1 Tax=Chiayiivirga flava TaxID=659595 RepID=A0A7W8D4K4_9GAMM|nr:rRNA pseudouridine synthase [Chiayiivirga flava]MBB5206581.1 23S rRNA pseudouridine2604 synthase [Chiayiivirga flava]